MQIGEQIIHLLIIQNIGVGRHHVATFQDGGPNAIVIGGRTAGKVRLLEHSLEAGTMQCLFAIGIVALRALLLVNGVAAHLRGRQLA